jgi:DNA-binding MarR family transcriptional regulator
MQDLSRDLMELGRETVVRTAPIEDLIGYALRRAQGVVYADLNGALARISLRPLQFTLLLMVAENPGSSQSNVCEALGIQKANCVPTMGELERRGYIIRRKSTADARSYELHITHKGKRILQRAGEDFRSGGAEAIHQHRQRARIRSAGFRIVLHFELTRRHLELHDRTLVDEQAGERGGLG